MHEASTDELAAHVYRDEIQRIKASNPDITHREAFSAAAKNVTLSLSSNIGHTSYSHKSELHICTDFYFPPLCLPFDQWAHFPHIHFGLMPDQGLKKNPMQNQVRSYEE
jgi:hypothetical protein